MAGPPAGPPEDPEARHAEQEHRIERKAHLMRLLALAEALELSDEQTLKLKAKLDQYDQQYKPLHDDIEAQLQILRRAARGEASAKTQVDAAIQKARALKKQLEKLDEQLFDQLNAGLDPQHRARLALAMGRMRFMFHDLLRHAESPPDRQ
jgi:hypothetical protein